MKNQDYFPGWAFRTVVVAVAALEAFFFGFVIVGDAGFGANESIHVVGAIAFTAFLVGGLIRLLFRPSAPTVLFQVIGAMLALVITAGIVGNPDNVGGQAGLFDWAYLIFVAPVAAVAVWYARRTDIWSELRPDMLLVVLAVVAAVPLVLYGVDAALTQRNSFPPASDPHHNAHWATMAQLAFTIPLVGLAASLRSPGWRLSAWTVAVATMTFGVASVMWPAAPSSLGALGGWFAIAGGGVFLFAAMRATGWLPATGESPESLAVMARDRDQTVLG